MSKRNVIISYNSSRIIKVKLIPLTLTFVFNSGVKSKDRKVFFRMIDSLQLIYNYFRSNTVNCTSIL